MDKLLDRKIDELSGELIKHIREIVRIPSIESEAQENMPFGEEVNNALLKALDISKNMGFKTNNIDGYMGYASYGEGDEYVGVLGHLDVVEVGDGWIDPPFSAAIKNERIYGRGVLDNKGPIISALYGLYAIKELGMELSKPVRIIFGTDEESGFKDLEYYLSKEKPPILGFTPDCKYPVVYGERGRVVFEIKANLEDNEEEKTKNFFDIVNRYFLASKVTGDRLGLDIEDKEFGITEMRNYNLVYYPKAIGFKFTISYTPIFTLEKLQEIISEKIGEGLTLNVINNFNPVKFEKDGFLVRSLQDAYEGVTGLDGTPVTTTGGTYAKAMPGIVPFGPSFPGQKGIAHNPNEYMDISDIILNAKIFARAIYKLAK